MNFKKNKENYMGYYEEEREEAKGVAILISKMKGKTCRKG